MSRSYAGKSAASFGARSFGQSALSFGARRSTQYTASRLEMMQMGVPEDYIDALLDEGYMERLIVANDQLNTKRRLRLQRYLGMNKIIFVFLCLQSLLGVSVALYKTILQPDILFSAEAQLEDVDLVLMLDAAKHNQKAMEIQHATVQEFTSALNVSLKNHKDNVKVGIQQNLTAAEAKEAGFFLKWLPFLKYLTSGATAEAHVFGGWLRISTGYFNAQDTAALHGFTRDLKVQEATLSVLDKQWYTSSAQWYTALQHCEGMIREHGNPRARRYCIIIGDNEAMCRKDYNENVLNMCKKWPKMCPKKFKAIGNLLEYEHEMDMCTEYAQKNIKNQNAEVIMMFTVKSQKEEQIRLANPSFRRFVQGATGCQIFVKNEDVRDEQGNVVSTARRYEPDESCLRFIMAHSFEDLMDKSKKVADLLKQTSHFDQSANEYKDKRYLFFLILPLNLVFYIVWSKIIRCTMAVQKTAHRAMGKKKKMIKVSKTLVEKERRDSMVEALEAQLTEVELAEVSSLRPAIACGVPMTLRARLKGGYIRKNPEKDVCDGNGQAFSEDAFWNFEPVELSPGMIRNTALQGGQRIRIRNNTGQVLRVNGNETGFVTDKKRPQGAFGLSPTYEEDGDADGEALGEDTEFFVEQLDSSASDDGMCRLGDTLRIKSAATGKYIRIHKDGRCDGLGELEDPECQFAADLGGSTISTSAVVTLRSARTASYMHAGGDGDLNALPGDEQWRYWMLEKKEGLSPVKETEGSAGDASEEAANADPSAQTSSLGVLKEGDVVTIRGMNQNYLEVLDDGTVRCGLPPGPKDEGGAGGTNLDAAAAQAASPPVYTPTGCTEFVIQRMGMGTVKKHDNTIRTGAEICLRPLRGPTSSNGDSDSSRYLSIGPEGAVDTNGRLNSRDISFGLELATVQEMVAPVQTNLMKGDCELMISPLWNKNEVKRLEALSAPWTSAAEMSSFRGAVVVANDNGQYTVPKAKGESFQGWVAVVKDGVDIKKAAKQAKSQGATGIIVRSTEVLSLEKLSRNMGEDPPELPAVFMDQSVADSLNERGINCQGCEFKGKNRTAALRSIGRAGAAKNSEVTDGRKKTITAATVAADVFRNVGALMVEEHIAKANEPEPDAQEDGLEDVEESDYSAGKGFQWKVASNTHYLWSSSAGGAARMNVNFGKKAPPSAAKKIKVDMAGNEVQQEVDASQQHVRRSLTKTVRKSKQVTMQSSFHNTELKGSLVGVTMIESSDLANHRLAGELTELDDLISPGQAAEPLEQLSDDSDFKIQYHFEEVEVAIGEKADELAEEELIDDSGAVVGRFAVPVKRFWMVAFGMVFSTVLLSMILYVLLNTASMYDGAEDEAHVEIYDPSFDSPDDIFHFGGDPAVQPSGFVSTALRRLFKRAAP
mmetsp:Transcript_10520/g.19355  ORF Transcript_10520/g.19355 Transcript_10520/m.19355 type:complete len:1392 (-) Transcript_10520:47-4222(-)